MNEDADDGQEIESQRETQKNCLDNGGLQPLRPKRIGGILVDKCRGMVVPRVVSSCLQQVTPFCFHHMLLNRG